MFLRRRVSEFWQECRDFAAVWRVAGISHFTPARPTLMEDHSMTALPPKPTHNFFPLRFSPPKVVSESERRCMIETTAYLRAERRNFAAGHEVEDWLAAEAEVDDRLWHARKLTHVTAW
jgi:hypothetical protein